MLGNELSTHRNVLVSGQGKSVYTLVIDEVHKE